MKPDKRLANTKVYVAGKSKEIQEKAFQLGYSWSTAGINEIRDTTSPFLFFYKNGIITHDFKMNNFMRNNNKEVTADYILSLEPECPFKPFDKVLVRDDDSDAWMPKFFSYQDDSMYYSFHSINNGEYRQCIPYEGNEHLAFTTDSPEQ